MHWALNASAFDPVPLDDVGLAYFIPHFLTEDEVQHVRRITGGSQTLSSGRASYASVEASRPWDRGADAVLAAIEHRMGYLVGIPPHADEAPMRISVNRPWAGSAAALGSERDFSLQNLHLDKQAVPGRDDGSSRRVVAVLAYLSDSAADDLEGGETLLPCLRGGASTIAPELCARLEAGYRTHERFLAPPGGGIYARHSCFDAEAAREASWLCFTARDAATTGGSAAQDGCDAARPETPLRRLGTGTAVVPQRGSAIVFDSTATHMWHGGCRVWRGEKWTIQHFKEAPPLSR